MGFKASLQSYKDVFVMPKTVVSQHLKLAGAVQLKVLLWLYANGGECESAEQIAKDIGMSSADVNDAMQYWLCAGLVLDSNESECEKASAPTENGGGEAKEEETLEKTETPDRAVVKIAASEPGRPTRFEAIKRASENREIAWLFGEAEVLFGHFVSDAERISMVWMVDGLGLVPAVVRMIIQHAAAQNKCNIRYIEKMAASWANLEIDTVEKAESHLMEIERRKKDWSTVCSTFGIEYRLPSEKEEKYATQWIREWKFTKKMLKLAYDTCVDARGSMNLAYINKILQNWFDNGINTPEKVEEDKNSKPAQKQPSGKSIVGKDGKKSYDISEYEKKLLS